MRKRILYSFVFLERISFIFDLGLLLNETSFEKNLK